MFNPCPYVAQCLHMQTQGGGLPHLFGLLFVSLKTQEGNREGGRRAKEGGRKSGKAEQGTGQASGTGRRNRDGTQAGKKRKISGGAGRTLPPPLQKKVVSGSGRSSQNGAITSTLYVSNSYIYTMYNDLTVRNGRLVNNRPNDVTGIQQAAQIKKDLKREQKIQMMEEAMYRAEMRADMMESLKEGKRY